MVVALYDMGQGAAPTKMAPQITIAWEGGSGTAVPDLSVEVDDLDEALRRVRAAGLVVEYGPTSEPCKCAGFTFEIRSAAW
jgi:hypothetical protein